MRVRRAFTLLELLLVIGVLAALLAIALPYGTGLVERQAYESVVDAVESQAASARAYAQREGVVVELVLTEDGSHIEARTMDLLALASEAGEPASADGMASALRGTRAARALGAQARERVQAVAARVGAQADDGQGEPGAIAESWASVAVAPDALASVDAPAELQQRPEFAPAAASERVAIFLPDGSAAAVRTLWISAGARTTRLAIDPLLGEIKRSVP